MVVQVKPIDINRWHGKSGKDSFTRTKVIQALVDPEKLVYQTGLSKEEETKYQEILKVDLSNVFSIDTPHPFWDSKMAEIKLENRTMFFNTENPIDFIKVKIMKNSKYVANSMKEYDEGYYPEATHVIYDESEEVDAKATIVEIKNKAIISTASLSKERKIELIMVLSADNDYVKMKNPKGKSDNFITLELNKLIEKKPSEVLKYLEYEKEYLSLTALGLEALQKNILQKEGHKIKYFDSVIATDIPSLVEYLSKTENSDFKVRLMAAINK